MRPKIEVESVRSWEEVKQSEEKTFLESQPVKVVDRNKTTGLPLVSLPIEWSYGKFDRGLAGWFSASTEHTFLQRSPP